MKGFGENGRVDLMDGLPRARRGERDYLNALAYSVLSPPIVVRDLVITPAAISSLVKTKEQIPGWIRGFDARTGKVRWTFRTVPARGEFGAETWIDGSNEYAGKVTVWTLMSADEQLGLVYLPTNTTAPDFYGALGLATICSPRAWSRSTWRPASASWHFQTVLTDCGITTNPAAPNLLDITVGGTRVKALAQITKQGFVYTFDRTNGKPVWPINERPVPPSDVPGEKASPTQPVPSKPAAVRASRRRPWTTSWTSRLRFAHLAVKAVEGFKSGPLYTPPSVQGTIISSRHNRRSVVYALTTGGSSGGPRLVAYAKATGAELASTDTARQRHRHPDDVSRQREAVHRADGSGSIAG